MTTTTIDEKQEAILSSLWNELEETGPVTLDRLTERMSGYIAWDGMPTDDAAHVLSVALPRIEKSIAVVGAQIEKGLKPRDTFLDEWRELEGRQIQIASEALAVIVPRDVREMRAALNKLVNEIRGDRDFLRGRYIGENR